MAYVNSQEVIYPEKFHQTYRDSKERNIVMAASRVFMESGFDNASMDDIAMRANVSKRTIYNRYASKQDVFDVAISHACKEFSRLSLKVCYKTPVEEFLENIGYQILEHRTRPDVLALQRLVLFQSSNMPGIGQMYYNESLAPIISFIEDYFEQISALGHVIVTNINEAAWDYFNLIRGPLEGNLLQELKSGANIGDVLRKYSATGTKKFLHLYKPSSA